MSIFNFIKICIKKQLLTCKQASGGFLFIELLITLLLLAAGMVIIYSYQGITCYWRSRAQEVVAALGVASANLEEMIAQPTRAHTREEQKERFLIRRSLNRISLGEHSMGTMPFKVRSPQDIRQARVSVSWRDEYGVEKSVVLASYI